MKYLKLLIFSSTFGLLLPSCQKYVDIKQNSNQTFIETANDCQLLLDNYAVMNVTFPSDGEVSADDYYVFDSKFNSLSTEEKALYNWDPSAQRNDALVQWQNPYKVIFYANLAIEGIARQKPGSTDQATLDNIRGQGLFFRGFTLWCIAQLYAKPYTATAAQDPGVPIRLTSDLNEVSSRETVQKVYTQVLSDLNEAVTLLSPTSPVVSRPNKAAAYAMLARVYLSMGDYQNALNSATAALALKSDLQNFNLLSQTLNTPFSPRFGYKEVIFHSVMGVSSPFTSVLNPSSSASGNTAKIDLGLYASYSSDDLRKSIFFKSMTTTNYPLSYRFSGNYEPVTNANIFNGLATDELYLIRAESYARLSKTTEALKDLNDLLITRFRTAGNGSTYVPYATTSATVALNFVLTERRKELVMRGLRWTDLRRLSLGAQRKLVSRTGETIVGTLQPNDLRYTLLIPREVITITGMPQNLR